MKAKDQEADWMPDDYSNSTTPITVAILSEFMKLLASTILVIKSIIATL